MCLFLQPLRAVTALKGCGLDVQKECFEAISKMMI